MAGKALSHVAVIADKAALTLRAIVLRTARSPLKPLWRGLYAAIARGVALVVAPRRARASVYLTGSLASGEPLYGLSDIDLVTVAADEGESRRVRRRYEALCRALPPLRGLIPHFRTYDARGLASILTGSYLVNGLADGRAVFLGADAIGDGALLLERPGLHGTSQWRRVRGRLRISQPPNPQSRTQVGWLELYHRWRHTVRACGKGVDLHRPTLAVGLVAEAARIWLWLARGERHDGKWAALERALSVMDAEEEGLRYALDVHRKLHRRPAVEIERLLACFVSISSAIASRVDEAELATGTTRVQLVGVEGGDAADVPLLDWRALALPVLDQQSVPGLMEVVEERLVQVHADPGDPAALMAAASGAGAGRVPALRRGSLLVEPTLDVWGRGRLRLVQCRATDPVSAALLDGSAHAVFPAVSGWSARDWARRAVAEHRAWLSAGRNQSPDPHRWIGARHASHARHWGPATLGLLLSAARCAVFLDSVEEGRPSLPLRFTDLPPALAATDPRLGADAAEACAALGDSRREGRPPPPELMRNLRRRVESLPVYAAIAERGFAA
jgi:hypothetical protein